MKPISEMTDQELVEAWLVGAHGATRAPDGWWIFGQAVGLGRNFGLRLPDILDSESAFNQWVLPVMKGMDLNMVWMANGLVWHRNAWENAKVEAFTFDHKNRRFRAAVEGALQIIREGE